MMDGEVMLGMCFMVANGIMQTAQQFIGDTLQNSGWPYYVMFCLSGLINSLLLRLLIWVVDAPAPLPEHRAYLLLRGTFGAANTVLTIMATIVGASLADVASLTSISNIMAALLGYAMLGERLQWVHAVAIVISIVGAVLVTKPPFIFGGAELTSGAALGYFFAVLASVSQACQYIMARRLKGQSALWQSASAMSQIFFAMLVMSLFSHHGFAEATTNTGDTLLWLLAVAGTLLFATVFTSAGAQYCPVRISATLNLCTRIVAGYLVQILVYHSKVSPLSVTGSVLMVASCVLTTSSSAFGRCLPRKLKDDLELGLPEPEQDSEEESESGMEAPQEIPIDTLRARARSRTEVLEGHGTHIAIIGAGNVGSALAHTLVSQAKCAKVSISNRNMDKARAEAMDLEDTSSPVKVGVATIHECGCADVIVITSGRGLQGGETRLDVLKANAAILKGIVEEMKPIKKTAKIIVASNPCDVLTYLVQEISGLPEGQVIGSGTVLDTRRIRRDIAQKLQVHASSVAVYVLGEHGESQFPAWSVATVGGVKLAHTATAEELGLDNAVATSIGKAAKIRLGKGGTAYGVASAVADIADAILTDKRRVMTVSVRPPGKKYAISLPTVVGSRGAHRIIDISSSLCEEETAKYNRSIEIMEAQAQTLTEFLH